MKSYKELLEQQEELARKVEEARKRELADAVAQVRTIVAEYGLLPRDIFSARELSPAGASAPAKKGAKVPPKYRNPLTGQTWTGRGKPPKWIEGKDREPFLIA